LDKDEVIERVEKGFEKFKEEYIGKLKKDLDEKNS
jgi:hypothetical protein